MLLGSHHNSSEIDWVESVRKGEYVKMGKYEMNDSGKREDTVTGAHRDPREGKGRYELISPHMLKRLARWLEMGAIKYDPRNWEKGFPMSRMLDSALRHLISYQSGSRREDHLAAAIFNIMAMIHEEEEIAMGNMTSEFDDLPRYGKHKQK